jgi:hypothetical protein
MTFEPMSTDDLSTSKTKTLVYANAGWGKTKQASYYQAMFGPGFVLSGESGLITLAKEKIHYLPFTRWDDESQGDGPSFRGIAKQMAGSDLKAMGYKWIMTDSLTEVADLCFKHFDDKGFKNSWDLYGAYGAALLGAVKWFRDLPYHVIVTSLVKEDRDDNGVPEYWPMLKGNQVQRQITGIFDNVLGGIIRTRYTEDDEYKVRPITDRFMVTNRVGGWIGKVRTPYPERVKPVERAENGIPFLIKKMLMSEANWKKYVEIEAASKAATTAITEKETTDA